MKPKLFAPSKLVAILGFLLIAASCHKPDKVPLPPSETRQLTRIDQDADNYLHLAYTGIDLTRVKLAEDGFALDYQLTYGNTGKPAEAILWGVYKYRFFYRAGLLIRVVSYHSLTPTEVEGYTTFTYDNSNRLVLATGYYTNGGDSFLENAKTAYTYYPNGDVRMITDSTLSPLPYRFVLEKRREFEYDARENPMKAANEVLYALSINPTPHNVTKEIFYDAIYGVEKTSTYRFQYNSKGFPERAVKTTVSIGAPSVVQNITYTY